MSESEPLDRRTIALDATVLLSIPLILTALHFLVPTPRHDQFIFYYHDPSMHTAWTSAFFHHSNDHLTSNIEGYAMAIVPMYILYYYWDRRRMFWLTVATLIVVVPFITKLVDLWIFNTYIPVSENADSQGFSGIASAFGGMLLVSIGLYLAAEYNRAKGLFAVELVIILAVGLLAFASGILSPLVAGLLVVGVTLVGSQLLQLSWVREPGRLVSIGYEHRGPLFVAGYGGLAVCLIIPAIFPVDVVQDGTLTNIFAHGTGFVAGFLITGIIWMALKQMK